MWTGGGPRVGSARLRGRPAPEGRAAKGQQRWWRRGVGAEGGKTVPRVEMEGLKPPVKNVFFPSWEAGGG